MLACSPLQWDQAAWEAYPKASVQVVESSSLSSPLGFFFGGPFGGSYITHFPREESQSLKGKSGTVPGAEALVGLNRAVSELKSAFASDAKAAQQETRGPEV